MEGMLVLLGYIGIFFALIALQVTAARKKDAKLWRILYLANVLAILGAYAAVRVFDSLPGTGMMPGLTWFAETLYSMGAVVLYGIQLVITVVLHSRKWK